MAGWRTNESKADRVFPAFHSGFNIGIDSTFILPDHATGAQYGTGTALPKRRIFGGRDYTDRDSQKKVRRTIDIESIRVSMSVLVLGYVGLPEKAFLIRRVKWKLAETVRGGFVNEGKSCFRACRMDASSVTISDPVLFTHWNKRQIPILCLQITAGRSWIPWMGSLQTCAKMDRSRNLNRFQRMQFTNTALQSGFLLVEQGR